VVDMAIECWQLPDASIWESRAGCSTTPTAGDVRLGRPVDRGPAARRALWTELRSRALEEARRAIHRRVTAEGYSRRLRSFTQTLGGRTVTPLARAGQVRFLEDRDPRIVSTVRAVAPTLVRERWSAATARGDDDRHRARAEGGS